MLKSQYHKTGILLLLIMLWCINIAGAQKKQTDTLKLAQSLRAANDYKGALSVLKTYTHNHPTNYYALWIYAQTEFWKGDIANSDKEYKAAISLAPQNDYLVIDYAKMLVLIGKWGKADSILKTVEAKGHDYAEGDYLHAQIAYLNGNYSEASKQVSEALYKDGTNTSAVDLYYNLQKITSPWIQVDGGYTTDNQPLQSFYPKISGGLFIQPRMEVNASFCSPLFMSNGGLNTAQWLQVGEQSTIGETGIKTSIEAGVVKYPFQNHIDYSASVYVSKSFFNHLLIEAIAEHSPYFTTLTSIDTIVSVYHLNIGAGWDDKNSWHGKISVDYNLFNDDNDVYSYNGWVYAPPIKINKVNLSIGYSYNYSNSKQSQFMANEPVSEIVDDYSASEQIAGIYKPYFTPNQQQVHSALLSFDYHINKTMELIANGGIGFYAIANAPYLYLNKSINESTYVAEDFYSNHYTPYNGSLAFGWQLKPKTYLAIQSSYQHTYFFNSFYIGATLKQSFWNEKKKK